MGKSKPLPVSPCPEGYLFYWIDYSMACIYLSNGRPGSALESDDHSPDNNQESNDGEHDGQQ